MDLNDKVAIVTGSGRGIGRAIAEEMARYGASVVISDLDEDAIAQVAADIGGDHPDVDVHSVPLNVTDDESVANMTANVINRFGRIDILVNNAGIIGAPGWEQREEPAEADWDQIYEVNVKGIARVTDSLADAMKTRRYGKIVNIASVAGRQGSPRNTPYNASKSGVISLTQAYALGLAPFNINVNAICPGLLWTPMWERIATRTINLNDRMEGTTPRQAFEQFVAQSIPLGREQTPQDIGRLAVFLASDLALNITGQAINVNGGSGMN
jgi:meso-butanediol dehydrogenase/(S,S)-butanediol dehydrogenase/diacetyl reductase